MSIPAHLWLEDENGSPISRQLFDATAPGFYRVKILFSWGNYSGRSKLGKLTGTRIHQPVTIVKEFDQTTPLLYRAVCKAEHEEGDNQDVPHSGNRYRSRIFQYHSGKRQIYHGCTISFSGWMSSTHLETLELRYEAITWKYTEGILSIVTHGMTVLRLNSQLTDYEEIFAYGDTPEDFAAGAGHH
jgi:type VI secretion system secreted protein Hcp